ncbi:serine hydrolase domain-containing protein [Flagellimonas iocasae]|uniref:Serine hydrolase domain-containing protein n=1 Tax=Flagellimonas iocasae TaxID=2055905 RepID=A0ABW4XY42_9FLAO
MKKLCAILIPLILTGQLVYPQTESEKRQTIFSYLNGLAYPEFSGVILLAQRDSVCFKKAYGYAVIEDNVENNFNTLFNTASITKTMTAVATLQLVDKGLLDLDIPIGRYLPKYPNQTVQDSVTAHHLLTHTSGLNNFLVDDFKTMGKLKLKTTKDYLPLFSSESLLFSPGTQYSYSAAGYIVLGLLIEEITGKDFHKYMNENVFKPAEMYNTFALPIDSIIKNKASGYTSYFGEINHLSKNDSFLSKANPAGFYYTTAENLLKFFNTLKKYQLISKDLTSKMMSPLVKGYYTNYGYGISVDKRFDQTIVGHTGGWYGVQCELMYFEDDEITAVILSNIDTEEGKGMNRVSNFIKHVLANKPMMN